MVNVDGRFGKYMQCLGSAAVSDKIARQQHSQLCFMQTFDIFLYINFQQVKDMPLLSPVLQRGIPSPSSHLRDICQHVRCRGC
jgi:hypothetical protein